MKQLSLNNERGASVTGVVLFIISLGLLARLGVGMIPAYIGDYQFNKLVAGELKKANDSKQTEKEFMANLAHQLNINANYTSKPEEMLIITNKTPGALTVKTQYEVESNFYGQTFIVNRFSKDITAADAQ